MACMNSSQVDACVLWSLRHGLPLPTGPLIVVLLASLDLVGYLIPHHHCCPRPRRRQEQREYYSQTASWTDIHPSQMLGPGACFKKYDLRTVTLEELQAPLKVRVAGWR